MADYYVDFTSGNDGDPGTIGSPWKTVDKASDVCKAGTLNPGDSVHFKRGETWPMATMDDTLEIEGSSGTIGNHIVFTDYGEGNLPVFDGGANNISLISHHSGDSDANYITIENIELTGTYDARQMAIERCNHWRFENLYLHDNSAPEVGPTAAALTIRKNARWMWVKNCTIENIDGGEGIYVGDSGNATDYSRSIFIDGCDISGCDMEGFDIKQAQRSVFIHDCTFTGNGSEGLTQMAAGGRHCVVYQCRFDQTASGCNSGIYLGRYADIDGIETGHEWHVERCLFTDQTGTYGALNFKGENNTVVNCTMVDCSRVARCDSNDGGNVVKNCVFEGTTGYEVYFDAGINENNWTFDYNDYGDGGTGIWYYDGASRDLAYVQGTLGQEANAISSDPSFAETTNYTLNVGSPCIDDGDSSVTVYDWDDEYAASGAVDMGWREYGWTLPHRVFKSLIEDTTFSRFDGYTGVSADNTTVYTDSYSMRANITDTTARYAYKHNLGNLKHFFADFEVNADDLTMSSGNQFNVWEGRTAGGTAYVVVQLYYDGSNVQVRAGVQDDAAAWDYTSYYNLSSGWNHVQFFWRAAPDVGLNHGELALWLNDVEKEHLEDKNNHDNTVDRFYVGAVSGLDAGTSGDLYIDAIRIDWVRYMDELAYSPLETVTGIVAAVTRDAATVDTAPYTQDFTTSDLEAVAGAVIYVATVATADGTATDHACFGVGVATADDEEWAAAFTDEDGQDPTDSASRNINDGCILVLGSGSTTVDGEASLNSFINDGSRVTWTNAPEAAYLITSYHFGGDNLSATAGTVSLGDAVDNAVVVNTLDFEPDIVIAVLQDGLTSSGSGDGVNFSMGAVHNGTTVRQRAYCLVSQDNQATSALAARYTETYGAMAITTAGALDYGVEFGTFTSSGFTVTTRNAGGNSSDLLYLALSFGGEADSTVLTVNTPIMTGSDTQPPPDFVPIFVMQMLTHCEAAGTAYTDGKAGAMCLSAFDEDNEYSNSIAIEDGAGTSNTQCLSDNQAVNLDQHDGTDGHEATFVAFSSWTLDFAKTLGTAKVGWAFALGTGTPTAEETGAAAVAVSSAVVVSDLRRHELYLTNDQGLRLADSEGRNPLTTFLWLRASRVVNGIGWIDVGVPLSFDTALFLKQDFMIQFWRAPRGGALSLWRPFLLRKWRFESFDGVDSVILSGPDVNDLLRRRWVIAYAGSQEANRSDYADDMMKALVTDSESDVIDPTPDAGTRAWSLLSVAGDLSAGPTISKGLSFKGPLLSPSGGGVLPEIARASRVAGTDLFFDVVTSSIGAGSIEFEFRTYTGQRGQDLSDILVFDEARGNMGNAYYDYDASQEITYVYGAGKGDGAARNIQQVYDSDRYGASVWNRCEAVADARNEDSDNAVREKARDLLQSGEPVERAGGTLKDTRETRYGVHWDFGDKVRARYKGHEFVSMISSMVLSVNKAGEQVVARWDYNSDV